jgi:hypothetical protein
LAGFGLFSFFVTIFSTVWMWEKVHTQRLGNFPFFGALLGLLLQGLQDYLFFETSSLLTFCLVRPLAKQRGVLTKKTLNLKK